MVRKTPKPLSKSTTLPRLGREKAGKKVGENKRQCLLEKWLKPPDKPQKSLSKAEDERGGGEARIDLGPGVSSLRRMFKAGEAEGLRGTVQERDPVQCGSRDR